MNNMSEYKTIVVKPHTELLDSVTGAKIFLAGTIDMGNSEDWQSEMIKFFIDNKFADDIENDLIIYNPRRDPGHGFDVSDKIEMDYQVNWELDALENADFIIMNLLPNSKSPISLLELGLFHEKMVVICPPEFYRYDNVRIVCDRYDVPLLHSINDFMEHKESINGKTIR